jgi:hypothetical protein
LKDVNGTIEKGAHDQRPRKVMIGNCFSHGSSVAAIPDVVKNIVVPTFGRASNERGLHGS